MMSLVNIMFILLKRSSWFKESNINKFLQPILMYRSSSGMFDLCVELFIWVIFAEGTKKQWMRLVNTLPLNKSVSCLVLIILHFDLDWLEARMRKVFFLDVERTRRKMISSSIMSNIKWISSRKFSWNVMTVSNLNYLTNEFEGLILKI